jgi:hypothetical protein
MMMLPEPIFLMARFAAGVLWLTHMAFSFKSHLSRSSEFLLCHTHATSAAVRDCLGERTMILDCLTSLPGILKWLNNELGCMWKETYLSSFNVWFRYSNPGLSSTNNKYYFRYYGTILEYLEIKYFIFHACGGGGGVGVSHATGWYSHWFLAYLTTMFHLQVLYKLNWDMVMNGIKVK